MKNKNFKIVFSFFFFKATNDTDCRSGDGVGGSQVEVDVSGTFTKEKCIIAVKEEYPNANGATFESETDCEDAGLQDECECYANFEMESWNDSGYYESCMFIESEFFFEKNLK